MTLRILQISDEHGDIRGNALTPADNPPVDVDMIINCGDGRAPGVLALHQYRAAYPDYSIPLFYVPGNHDFYSEFDKHNPELKTTVERQLKEMPEVADKLQIHLLMDSMVELVIAGMRVRTGGGTLWTDYQARPGYLSMNDAMRDAAKQMNDYRLSKVEPGRSRDVLTPRHTINMHRKTARFIDGMLSMPVDDIDAVIVATHHAPSYRSLRNWDPAHPERFSNLDWCYASNLDHLMTGVRPDGTPMPDGWTAPNLWLHGHVHKSHDYFVGEARVCCNPRGYPFEALNMRGRENPNYDPRKIIEIEPRYTPTFRM